MKDHLGNVRYVFDATGASAYKKEEHHYYPFGLRLGTLDYVAGSDPSSRLYNSKELVDDHYLNWYHYGARYYDPQVGRWWVVDPVDEQYSPYTYCFNNPIILIDPDGRHVDPISSLWNWFSNELNSFFNSDTDPSQLVESMGDVLVESMESSPVIGLTIETINEQLEYTYIASVSAGPSVDGGILGGVAGEAGLELAFSFNLKEGAAVSLYGFIPDAHGWGTPNGGVGVEFNIGSRTSNGYWSGYSYSPTGLSINAVQAGLCYHSVQYYSIRYIGSDVINEQYKGHFDLNKLTTPIGTFK